MARRSPETLADYLVVAISPALIMLLVGSLVFFLIEVFYQGQYQGRLLFVMAMFVMAIVCVARIAMEEGAGYAALFGVPLALVAALAMARFVEVQGPLAPVGQVVNWGLLALVWWSAHKLTWDCTLIDDSQDASGHGLLQELGFDRPAGANGNAASGTLAGTSSPAAPLEATSGGAAAPLPWWRQFLEADRRPHAPGLWVVYFSLAALPLFGVGGWFIPATAADVRQRAFLFLVVYVASGLTLLLSTSFLGLRRYLRQRRLAMPMEMAATWVGVGLVMIVATLLICALVPRPDGVWSLAKLPIEFTSPDNRANRVAAGPEGAKEDPNRPSSSTADAQKGQQAEREGGRQRQEGNSASQAGEKSQGKSGGQQEQKGQSGGDSGKSSAQGKSSEQSKSSDGQKGKSDSGKSDSKTKGESQNAGKSNDSAQSQKSQSDSGKSSSGKQQQQQSQAQAQPESNQATAANNPPPPPSSPPASSIRITSWLGAFSWLLKALFYLAILIAAIVAAYLYREQIAAAWKKLLADLRDLWARWFGQGQPTESTAAAPQPAVEQPHPFAAFRDPFDSGAAARMPWAELVRYSFQALEAFGRESGCPRAAGQTPYEFAAALSQAHPPVGRPAATLADWYGQLAYASRPAPNPSLDPLRQLWTAMHSSRASAAAAL